MIRDDLARKGISNGKVLELFREAQDELIKIIEGIDPESPFREFRRKQLRQIELIVMRLEVDVRDWTSKAYPPILNAGARETYNEIKQFEEKDFPVKFAGVDEDTIQAFVQEAYLDFGTTMVGLTKDAQRKALERKKMQDRVLKGFITGASVFRTQRDLIRDMKRRGFTVLKAKNGFGRRFSLEHYTNMLVRTQNVTAYNIGSKSQLLKSGRRYGVFPTIRPDIDGEDICNEWERKKFVDLLKDDLPPASTHPNCRHTVLPASFEQLKAERPDLYKKALAYHRETV